MTLSFQNCKSLKLWVQTAWGFSDKCYPLRQIRVPLARLPKTRESSVLSLPSKGVETNQNSLWKIILQSHWEKSVTNDQCPFLAASNIHVRLKMPSRISPCFHDNFLLKDWEWLACSRLPMMWTYRKIPKISPRDLYFSKAFFEGLIFGGAYTWRGLNSEFYGMYRNKLLPNIRLLTDDWMSLAAISPAGECKINSLYSGMLFQLL